MDPRKASWREDDEFNHRHIEFEGPVRYLTELSSNTWICKSDAHKNFTLDV